MSQALRELIVSIDFNDVDAGALMRLDRAIDEVESNVINLGGDITRMGGKVDSAGREGSRAMDRLGSHADGAGDAMRHLGADASNAGDKTERSMRDASHDVIRLADSADRAGDAFRDMGNDGSKLKHLTATLDNVNGKIELQERKLAGLRESLDQTFNDTKRNKLQAQILQTEGAILSLTRQSDRTAREIWKIEDAMKEASRAADRMADNASDALRDVTREAGRAEDAIDEIGDTAEKTGRGGFGKIKDALSEIAPQSKAAGLASALFSNPWILATVGVVAAIAGVGIGIASMVSSADADFKKMQAQLGYTAEQMQGMKETSLDVFERGFGENLGEVTNDVRIMKQNFKDLSDESLGALTGGAYTLKELFGPEIKETSKVVKTMTANFKDLSEQDAMDLITTGFQKGGDYADDFMDTVNEYSMYFNKMGVSADKFIGTLIRGGEAGAFNIDKVGDAFKEVGIRAMDGSKGTVEAFTDLGFNAEKMGQDYAAGGAKAEQALMATVAALSFVEDKQKQNEIGVKLFGTQWEDMREDVIFAIDGAEEAVAGFEGATERATETMQDTVGSKWERITRGFKTSLIEAFDGSGGAINGLLDKVLQYMPQIVDGIQSAIDWVSDIFTENQDTIMSFTDGVSGFFSGLSTTIQALWGYLGPFISSTFSGALDVVLSVAGTALDLVGGIFTAFGQLLTGDWSGLWSTVKGIFNGALDGLIDVGRALLELLFGVFDSTIGRIIEAVGGVDLTELGKNMIDGLINGVKSLKDSAIQTVKDVAQGMWDGVKSFFGIASPSKLMAQAGQWIIEGLKNGVLDRAKDAIESIKSVAKSMWDSVTNFFGIHSPSRLMAETGRFVVEGMEVGITDNAYKALGAAQEVSGGIASALGQTAEIDGILSVTDGKPRTTKEIEDLLKVDKPSNPQPEPNDGYPTFDAPPPTRTGDGGGGAQVVIENINVNIPPGTNVNDPAAMAEAIRRAVQEAMSGVFSGLTLSTGQ